MGFSGDVAHISTYFEGIDKEESVQEET